MRILTILSLLLLASPAFGELTKADLHDLKEDLHKVIKEEIVASEKRMKEYIDLKIDALDQKVDALDKSLNGKVDALEKSVDGRFDNANGYFDPFGNLDPFWIAMVMIVFLIILPQLIILYKEIRDRKKNCTQIQELRERIEALT